MRTIVYVDGYNLYYGLLRGTDYKWLDVVRLCESICRSQNPQIKVEMVKFFSAPIKAKISTRGDQAVQSQRLYWNVLRRLYPDQFVLVEGFFQVGEKLSIRNGSPFDKADKVSVVCSEEKQTDVNIALHMYKDVVSGDWDQVILMSTDSDFVPVFEFVREANPGINIGSIFPRREPKEKKNRPPNKKLEVLSNWSRHYILDQELAVNQLPEKVPTKKKPVFKPSYW